MRSLLYGSAAGVAGCVLLVAVAARALDVSAPAELRERLAGAAEPLAGRLQGALLPVRARIQVRSLSKQGSKTRLSRWLACCMASRCPACYVLAA